MYNLRPMFLVTSIWSTKAWQILSLESWWY